MGASWIKALILLIGFMQSTLGGIPSTVQKCRYDDQNCVARSMENIIENFGRTGIREMGLIPFDPLHIKTLKLARNPNSPVNIELSFKEIDVTGLADVKVRHIKGFTETISDSIETEVVTPKIVLSGPYTVDGSVLILPIVGKGNSQIVLDDVVLVLKTKNKPFQKDGKTYLGFDSMRLDIKPKRVHFNLEGLFNGNKELGDNMNKFINENWSDIYNELKPAITEAFTLIIKHMITSVFAKYPYESYFEH